MTFRFSGISGDNRRVDTPRRRLTEAEFVALAAESLQLLMEELR